MKAKNNINIMLANSTDREIVLNEAEWTAFMKALTAPTRKKPRLEELLKSPSVFERSE